MQSPGWQPTLCVLWCLIWWIASLEKYGHTWHRMSLLRPGVIKQQTDIILKKKFDLICLQKKIVWLYVSLEKKCLPFDIGRKKNVRAEGKKPSPPPWISNGPPLTDYKSSLTRSHLMHNSCRPIFIGNVLNWLRKTNNQIIQETYRRREGMRGGGGGGGEATTHWNIDMSTKAIP